MWKKRTDLSDAFSRTHVVVVASGMRNASIAGTAGTLAAIGVGVLMACGSGREPLAVPADAGVRDPGDTTPLTDGGGFGGLGGQDGAAGPDKETRDPVDCEEAKTSKSYVGCDYWPTITPNAVWSIFDYAVVVANTGKSDATVTITGPASTNRQVVVPAGQLRKVFLPWVPQLKGPDADECGSSTPLTNSIYVTEGAYHLVSSSPVIVYQFNALQYKGEGEGSSSADGGAKDWSSCPGSKVSSCPPFGGDGTDCFSYSNDASLLLPSTAMTTNYRVTAYKGVAGVPFLSPGVATSLSITATEPNTTVTVSLSSLASVVASSSGPAIAAKSSGGTLTLTLAKAGDVAQLVGQSGKDFSGSLVQSSKPVQVVSSIPCITIDQPACDHIEETVMPAETLGKRYLVAPPSGPKGTPVAQLVRLFGNQDGTTLTYAPSKPTGCPDTLEAGQMVECGILSDAFEVTGNKEFAVATFLLGAASYSDEKGDPSQSIVASTEQFRTKYVFLAPKDYPVLWADIMATEDADLVLDNAPVAASWQKIGNGPYGVYRVDLTKSGQNGAHTLTAKTPVGVQVIGFGDNTSFQYPAGLNLGLIAPPPAGPK
jgi:hypothetical protein